MGEDITKNPSHTGQMSGFSADDNGKFSDTRDVNTALQQGLLKKAFVGGLF